MRRSLSSTGRCLQGSDERQMGYLAQEVEEVVARHGAEDMGLVCTDGQGWLGINLYSMVGILHQALQHLILKCDKLEQAQGTVLLTAMGHLMRGNQVTPTPDELMEAVQDGDGAELGRFTGNTDAEVVRRLLELLHEGPQLHAKFQASGAWEGRSSVSQVP